MQSSTKRIKVFEHELLYIDEVRNQVKFELKHYVALSKLNILHDNLYFDTRHNGIKFKQFVGVIQVDGLTIEILPKIDNSNEKADWQKVLIEMLKVTRKLNVQKVGNANVKKQNIHLLDIYFEWFLNEVQLLIHQGLIKQYYKETSNVKALKGKLEFAGHITKNLVHKERFYTTHQVYDKDHLLHQIIAKALSIVEKCSKGNYLYSKCKTVQLDFPEVKDIAVNEATFTKIPQNRKTAPYQTAIEIAKFIILNYAPNISSGSEKMLALLFDMNNLWEEYILACLKKANIDRQYNISGQQSTSFWNGIKIRPDIVIEKEKKEVDRVGVVEETKAHTAFVIDTKWKNIGNIQPSTHDLRQMYVYNDYWKSTKAMLLYPSNETETPDFKSFNPINNKPTHHLCGVGKVCILNDKGELNAEIGNEILGWFD
jgi:5-methylcytosine-specific restriction enzyme subunit McrC